MLAPARTPKSIIDRISQEIAAVLRTPEVSETLLNLGADPLIGGPQDFAAIIKRDLVRYAKLIKDANIRLE
jgi:tripartite-type tricarboxylate transporter receptor subunit TctC